jgi:hypothetical protein
MTGGDGLHGSPIRDEAGVIFLLCISTLRTDSGLITEESQGAVKAGLGTDHARNGQADALEAAHVLAGIVGIEE